MTEIAYSKRTKILQSKEPWRYDSFSHHDEVMKKLRSCKGLGDEMRPERGSSYPEGHCSSSTRHAFFLLNSMKTGTTFYWESWVRKNTSIWKFSSSDTSTLWFPWMELVSLFPSSQPSDYNFFSSEMLWCLWTLTCRDFRIQNKILVEQERRSREHCLFMWRNFMAFLPSV